MYAKGVCADPVFYAYQSHQTVVPSSLSIFLVLNFFTSLNYTLVEITINTLVEITINTLVEIIINTLVEITIASKVLTMYFEHRK